MSHLKSRFTENYKGANPYVSAFQYTDSWKDANQCLQLCDLLTGCLYQELSPSKKQIKQEMKSYLETSLKPFKVDRLAAGFWKQYDPSTLGHHLEKYSAWFWKPKTTAQIKKLKREKRKRERG